MECERASGYAGALKPPPCACWRLQDNGTAEMAVSPDHQLHCPCGAVWSQAEGYYLPFSIFLSTALITPTSSTVYYA
jgi:hypothetical protein